MLCFGKEREESNRSMKVSFDKCPRKKSITKNESLVLFHLVDPNHSRERESSGELPDTEWEKKRVGSVVSLSVFQWKKVGKWLLNGKWEGEENKKKKWVPSNVSLRGSTKMLHLACFRLAWTMKREVSYEWTKKKRDSHFWPYKFNVFFLILITNKNKIIIDTCTITCQKIKWQGRDTTARVLRTWHTISHVRKKITNIVSYWWLNPGLFKRGDENGSKFQRRTKTKIVW